MARDSRMALREDRSRLRSRDGQPGSQDAALGRKMRARDVKKRSGIAKRAFGKLENGPDGKNGDGEAVNPILTLPRTPGKLS
jgi:hypothetical protein